MTLYEALRSGKRIAREGCLYWTPVSSTKFSFSEVTANDWKAEEKSINITKSQLEYLVAVTNRTALVTFTDNDFNNWLNILIEKMGLKE